MALINWVCAGCRSTLSQQARSLRTYKYRRTSSSNSKVFRVSEEVRQALNEKRPVVALESTIYTHGFAYPDNLALASRLESLVRTHGGVPATVGVLDGVAMVGMAADEIIRLVASAGSPDTFKVSRRDLGFVCGLTGSSGRRLHGGTTVSATMVLAHLAGIKVFATGGIGGVHRGGEESFDISADLTELGKTPLTVISSGCKSFLDIPRTIEYLETQGVAVATFADGREGKVDFPAFWTRDSGVSSPRTIRDEAEAARVIHAHHSLGLQSGLHFANPIPAEHSIPLQQMEAAIGAALQDAKAAGATGAASTPYILAKVKELTGSGSVAANKSLVEANVIRGTRVAVELMKLEREDIRRPDQAVNQMVGPAASNYTPSGITIGLDQHKDATHAGVTESPQPAIVEAVEHVSKPANVFVAGSLAIDLSCDYDPRPGISSTAPELHTSNPAVMQQSPGGVGQNVARAAHLMGADVRLCSAVGDDLSGKAVLEALASHGMSGECIKTLPSDGSSRTAQYVAINDSNKDLVLAMADMSILEQTGPQSPITNALETFWLPQLHQSKPTHLVIDGNWPAAHLATWLSAGKDISAHITFEPVSTSKATGIFQLPKPHKLSPFPSPSIHLATPNSYELASMYAAARSAGLFDRSDWWTVIDALGIPDSGARTQLALATSNALVDQGVPQQSIQLLPFIPAICTKLGAQGVLLTQLLPAGDERLHDGDYAPYILSRCRNETESTVGVGGIYMRLFPAVEQVEPEDVVSVNGVGDTFAGTLVAGLAKRGKGARVEDLIDVAQRAAVLSLRSAEAVSPGLGTLSILL